MHNSKKNTARRDRPAANKKKPSPSILIILTGSLGDVARGLCLVSHIKSHWPHSRVSWLIERKKAELVSIHPQLDDVIIFDRSGGIRGILNLRRALHREQFDITLDLQRIFKSGFFSLLSRARRRIGFHRRNCKEMNWLFNNEKIPFYHEDLPKLDHYLKFTEHLGLPVPDRLDFGLVGPQLDKALPPTVTDIRKSCVAVVMGSSWESKDWHFEGYLQLVRRIGTDLKRRVVLLGGSSQGPAAQRLIKKSNPTGVIDLTGNSLVEMTAVLEAAAAAVGPDSGPGHLAAAVGTPYVTLFGPTPAGRHAPYGCEDLVVISGADCAPCYAKRCREGTNRCMLDIDVQVVVQKITRALARSQKSKK